jgi:hypothetical protein
MEQAADSQVFPKNLIVFYCGYESIAQPGIVAQLTADALQCLGGRPAKSESRPAVAWRQVCSIGKPECADIRVRLTWIG